MELNKPLQSFPGIGPAKSKALARLGLERAGDLLTYFPRSHEDRTRHYLITQAPEGESVCICAMVADRPTYHYIRNGLSLTKCRVVDDSGQATLVFFNQDYIAQALVRGETYLFYGRVEQREGQYQMTNPLYEEEGRARFMDRIVPIYPLTAGVSNNLLCSLAAQCVEGCVDQVEDCLPHGLRQDHGLAAAEYAVRNIHFPEDQEALAIARRRLAFEELFILSCGMGMLRGHRKEEEGTALPAVPLEEFLALLPFAPTGAQRRAMEAVAADLTGSRPMNRMIQGDVGSGKTAVAAFAAWMAHRGGAQAAMMAPTEILAHQHFENLSQLLAPAGLRVELLTGSLKASEKKAVKARLAAGEIDLIVGTHAILSQGVAFRQLALVITDEQHRFGVAQRAALSSKAERPPHVLVMSATPIPRTMALMIYGELDVTVIDELPPGRTPVATYLVGEDKRQRMYGFVRKHVEEGRQVYIICPSVEDNPGSTAELKAVTSYAENLQRMVFPDLRVAFVHGKLKAREKTQVMDDFAAGRIDILVSTTVVEVGVDVPNAALMIIENADRFGLSQLHQLRGRVGRGRWQSTCVLVSSNYSPETRDRLRFFTHTTDGFRIAEQDLQLRGPGDFFGQRQHGLPTLKAADLVGDTRTLTEAQEAAAELLAADPELSLPEHAGLRRRVEALFSEEGDIFN